jgi:hypothetical protein
LRDIVTSSAFFIEQLLLVTFRLVMGYLLSGLLTSLAFFRLTFISAT